MPATPSLVEMRSGGEGNHFIAELLMKHLWRWQLNYTLLVFLLASLWGAPEHRHSWGTAPCRWEAGSPLELPSDFSPLYWRALDLGGTRTGVFAGFGGVRGWQEPVLGALHVAALRKWIHSTRWRLATPFLPSEYPQKRNCFEFGPALRQQMHLKTTCGYSSTTNYLCSFEKPGICITNLF